MYRLVLYYLIVLVGLAVFLSFFHLLPFNFLALILSAGVLVIISLLTNEIFAKVFRVSANAESVYISALILALIITPISSTPGIFTLFWISVLMVASKFILAIKNKHIFNPAAMAVFLTSIFLNQSASWWVGTLPMLPVVVLGGLLVVRKLRRFDLVISFLIVALLTISGFSLVRGNDLSLILKQVIVDSPLLFFACVMLTEPLTSPPTRRLRVFYGSLVGFLFSNQIPIGQFITTPESALLIGNLFSYLVSPKQKLMLKLKDKMQLSPDIYDFVFASNQKLEFLPGQYMEWTLGVKNPDTRGNRRYFTLASSPTEDDVKLGIKFSNNSSGFKKQMLDLSKGDQIVAGQLSGEFTLPSDPNQKLVFIAGGIGITPFRSMIKYLLDKKEKRGIILFYSAKTLEELVYKDLFDSAVKEIGIKMVYILTDKDKVPKGWKGKLGHIDEKIIKSEVPDYKDGIFYLSGPRSMVTSFENILNNLGVSKSQIKTDYFPGFA